SATYYCRWAAKHVVASGLASRCEIQVAYVIGVAEPVSLRVDTFGTGTISEQELTERVSRVFDFRPAAISRDLKLNRPLYSATSAGGHFGRPPTDEGHFEWERLTQSRLDALNS
ncbi:MAG: methionine adenosyltransferase domain-containing protein, partial [Candidatus Thermoplasmatota archaeon]|nr:methionine adenosyltransferase domain-containing protein [Candidatus Thermoplasmatota archaeon]